jgi:hypothetical protein
MNHYRTNSEANKSLCVEIIDILDALIRENALHVHAQRRLQLVETEEENQVTSENETCPVVNMRFWYGSQDRWSAKVMVALYDRHMATLIQGSCSETSFLPVCV